MLERFRFVGDIGKLKPCVNEIGFDIHYNKIYKGHVDEFNAGEGDFVFNKAAAHLHHLYFENIRDAREENMPYGPSLKIITERYGNYQNFLKTFEEQSLRLQGSGWVFMNKSGYLNIIPNNRQVENIALIVDLWEHAYAFTHGHDKLAYVKTFQSIIDWDVVNSRLQ